VGVCGGEDMARADYEVSACMGVSSVPARTVTVKKGAGEMCICLRVGLWLLVRRVPGTLCSRHLVHHVSRKSEHIIGGYRCLLRGEFVGLKCSAQGPGSVVADAELA
jgi:hypothetical protein